MNQFIEMIGKKANKNIDSPLNNSCSLKNKFKFHKKSEKKIKFFI